MGDESLSQGREKTLSKDQLWGQVCRSVREHYTFYTFQLDSSKFEILKKVHSKPCGSAEVYLA